MDKQTVLMEKNLAELVQKSTPKRVTRVVTSTDADFEQILTILGRSGQVSDERKPTIKIDLEAAYFFAGIKNLENGKHSAVYMPRFWIAPMENNNDRGWEVERFRDGDTYFEDMKEIMKVSSVEIELLIEDTTVLAFEVDNSHVAPGKVWLLKR